MTSKNKKDKKVTTIDELARLMHGEFLGVHQRLGVLEFNVQEMKRNSSELFAKLDEFISLYRDSKQEVSLLAKQLRRLEERVMQLESEK